MCQHAQDLEFEDVAQVCNEIAHIQEKITGIAAPDLIPFDRRLSLPPAFG